MTADMSYYVQPAPFLAGWIIFWLFCYTVPFFSFSFKSRKPLPDDSRAKHQFLMIVVLATLMHTAGFFEISSALHRSSFFPQILQQQALTIFLFGLLLAMFGRYNIRSLSFREVVFSINPEKSNFPSYTFLKHPMYAGLTLAFLGFLLGYPTGIGAASFIAIILIFLKRAARE